MNFISITDLNREQILGILARAKDVKYGNLTKSLNELTFGLLFEKPSLRTKVSFQVGIQQLGGYSIYLGPDEVGLGKRETIEDIATVLSSYVHGIVARVNSHSSLIEMAEYSKVPVVNALSDEEHPCQVIADLLTISENKPISPKTKVTFVGDGNNVSRSLALLCASVGMSFSIATPKGYELDQDTQNQCKIMAQKSGSDLLFSNDVMEVVQNSDVVYTDAWTSMGQEEEADKRRRDFKGFSVNEELLRLAAENVIFMHDMPVHYGEEVPTGMLKSTPSVAYEQAYNRLPAQQAILESLYTGLG